MTAALTLDRVSKRYRSATGDQPRPALQDVSFTVARGESVGIIGPNGAGKSTVLKVVAGVSAPTSGRVTRVRNTAAVLELGAGVHPDLTGRENLRLLDRLGPFPGRSAQPEEIVEFAELRDVIDDPVRTYSTGMRARLAFSAAIHAGPELLLVDEVLSVGDLAFQERCRARIGELHGAGTTVVLVSHDLELVAETCSRALLLIDGLVDLDDTADRTILRYRGQPIDTPTPGAGDLATIVDDRPPIDGPLRVRIAEPGRLRFEYVSSTPELVVASGHAPDIVFGSTELDVTSAGSVVELSTACLPRGTYRLHVSSNGRTDALPFHLDGASGGLAIRLRGSVRVDGVHVGAFGGAPT